MLSGRRAALEQCSPCHCSLLIPTSAPNASSSGSLSLAAWFAGPACAKRGCRVAGGWLSFHRENWSRICGCDPVPLLCGGSGGVVTRYTGGVALAGGLSHAGFPAVSPSSSRHAGNDAAPGPPAMWLLSHTGEGNGTRRGSPFSSSSNNSCCPGPHRRVDTAGAQGRREDEEAVTGRAGRPRNSWLLRRCSQWPARRPRRRAHRRP